MHQREVIQNLYLEPRQMKTGVPQGSTVSPLLQMLQKYVLVLKST